jgi:hypothetical protein
MPGVLACDPVLQVGIRPQNVKTIVATFALDFAAPALVDVKKMCNLTTPLEHRTILLSYWSGDVMQLWGPIVSVSFHHD